MKAYLINPFDKTVTEVETDGSLTDLYRLTDSTTVEAVGLNLDNDTMFVDEEGLLGDLTRQAFFELIGDVRSVVLAGRGVVVGIDDEGNTCEPSATLDMVKNMIAFKTLAELRARAH